MSDEADGHKSLYAKTSMSGASEEEYAESFARQQTLFKSLKKNATKYVFTDDNELIKTQGAVNKNTPHFWISDDNNNGAMLHIEFPTSSSSNIKIYSETIENIEQNCLKKETEVKRWYAVLDVLSNL